MTLLVSYVSWIVLLQMLSPSPLLFRSSSTPLLSLDLVDLDVTLCLTLHSTAPLVPPIPLRCSSDSSHVDHLADLEWFYRQSFRLSINTPCTS